MSGKPLVLIADDLEENRLTIKIALKEEGYEFVEAANGKEAVLKSAQANPDVILIDAIMPVLDGFGATKKIRKHENTQRIPILMISALSNKYDKINAIECGVNDFISKPFDKIELISRCKSYISMSNLNKKYILASKDPVTNLPNKSALTEDIKKVKNPKLLLIRIEDYEMIEEFYSEEIARKIEYEFSKKIFKYLPAECFTNRLYRTSEGEFALLYDDFYDDYDNDLVMKRYKIFQENVKDNTIRLNDHDYNISVVLSFGNDLDNLYAFTRIGLNYAIKTQNEIVLANKIIDNVHKEISNNIKTIKMIKEAIDNSKIISHFQPLYNNKTKQIEKYESLVRIEKGDGEIVLPFFFLDVAKKSKYYSKITSAVIKNSFKELKNTDKEISINLSVLDIEDKHIKKEIIETLKQNQHIAKRVVFELLEDENSKDFNSVKRFIKEVKSFGVKIAIDDFGSGYSNFERLLEFEPDILKIDGSLIKNIEHDEYSRKIVETIHTFAAKIGTKTVAEFVSNEAVFKIINDIGIDYSQGYFIGKPVSLVETKKG